MERQTAKKVGIRDITEGEWIKREGLEPSFIITQHGEEVARARIMGTVVTRFVADDGNFASITVDDSTDTIRVKTFQTAKPVEKTAVGDLVDIVGKVRVYNNEVYMIPEVVRKVADANEELLRRLDINRKLSKMKASGKSRTSAADKMKQREQLRKDVIKLLEKNREGMTFEELIASVNLPEEAVEPVLNDLLAEGICYEPTPGRIRKI
ncbi:MAG: hypothetical protein HY367_03090 [Candidatus Aenigmarchaeota archaeon]|nr:hypothetical protein [Candidatus Aenigmarchaeota archaeon]